MNPSEWFTEQVPGAESAFSLKIKQKVHEEQSEFQHLEIYETETFGNLMVIDGCTMVSTHDNFRLCRIPCRLFNDAIRNAQFF